MSDFIDSVKTIIEDHNKFFDKGIIVYNFNCFNFYANCEINIIWAAKCATYNENR